MGYMFSGTFNLNFNQPLNNWNVSNVTNMSYMFGSSNTIFNIKHNFNQPLNNWDVSNVTDMSGMFYKCKNFNQPLNNWDVSNVTDMEEMFYRCINFNQPLNNWNVSNVTNMYGMFWNCISFNQPLNNWNVLNVTDMRCMFHSSQEFIQVLFLDVRYVQTDDIFVGRNGELSIYPICVLMNNVPLIQFLSKNDYDGIEECYFYELITLKRREVRQ